jgi:predicted outer membrane repeat protein
VSTWEELRNGTSNCTTEIDAKCIFELAEDFMSPAEGFECIEIQEGQNVSINGNGHAVVNAHGHDSIFIVNPGGVLSITGVTMQNGRSTYIVNDWNECVETSKRLSRCCGLGGAVCVGKCAFASFTACVFRNNTAYSQSEKAGSGGALALYGTCIITLCTFKNNTAYNHYFDGGWGGAVLAGYRTTIAFCTFAYNGLPTGDYVLEGGAICMTPRYPNLLGGMEEEDHLTVSFCTFEYNQAATGGGAILVRNTKGATITSCTFENNQAGIFGGAIMTDDTHVSVESCIFRNNTASQGGAICLEPGSVTITFCTFEHNVAVVITVGSGGMGGAVFGAYITIISSSFTGTPGVYHVDSVLYDSGYGGGITFACLNGGVKPVTISSSIDVELEAWQLPPAKNIVICP